jgi:hypothetical protein
MHKIMFPLEKKTSPILLEMYNEVSLASASGFRSKKDDFLDTISMLSVMKPFAPSVDTDVHYNKDGGYWDADAPVKEASAMNSYLGGI